MEKKPLQPQDKYVLRLPDGMRDRIAAAARANGRSMNAEIISTLEDTYPPDRTIEDTIYFAKQILSEYAEVRDFPRLRELREMLAELVQQLEAVRSVQNADEDKDPYG